MSFIVGSTSHHHYSHSYEIAFGTDHKERFVNEQMTHMMHIAKKLKLKSSFYSDIWSMTKEYLGLKHERHVLKSRMSFLDEPHPQKSEGWWEEALKGQLWQSELGAIEQQQKIAREYAQELWERPESTDLFVRLFTSSKLGLDIQSVGGLGGPRDNSDQSNMRKDMIAAYCLECLEAITGTSTEVHDPPIFILGQQKRAWTEFSERASRQELFTYKNRLFLHKVVEKALGIGEIAIVPDVDLEPADIHNLVSDAERRKQLLRDWQAKQPKEYHS
ncbi:hypothetical protein V8E54_004156 [Elaphomyces granulatus]